MEGGGEKRMLASELERLQALVRDLEASVDLPDLPATARELCGALASSVDKTIRIVGSYCPGPESPESGDGSPLRDGGKANAQCKRRKGTLPTVRKQVPVASVTDTAALDDGFSWRKYGQKEILGAKYPRAYFRCTHRRAQNCLATKQVQRTDGDPLLYDVAYHGAHTCAQAPHLAAGQEQTSLHALETEGFIQAEEAMTPLSFGDVGGFFPPLSPASMEDQLWSSYAAGGPRVDMQVQFEDFFSTASDCLEWEFQNL